VDVEQLQVSHVAPATQRGLSQHQAAAVSTPAFAFSVPPPPTKHILMHEGSQAVLSSPSGKGTNMIRMNFVSDV
jgi:hypothetical protein